MSVAELTLAITLGIVFGKLLLAIIELIVEYPAKKRHEKKLKELVNEMRDVTDRMFTNLDKVQAKPVKRTRKAKVTIKKTVKKGKK